jgi:hypothetical protein
MLGSTNIIVFCLHWQLDGGTQAHPSAGLIDAAFVCSTTCIILGKNHGLRECNIFLNPETWCFENDSQNLSVYGRRALSLTHLCLWQFYYFSKKTCCPNCLWTYCTGSIIEVTGVIPSRTDRDTHLFDSIWYVRGAHFTLKFPKMSFI